MKTACMGKKHKIEVHDCMEKIINAFKHDMIQVPRKEQEPRIILACTQVDDILAYAALMKYHPTDHKIEWESVVYHHRHDLMCGKCGNSFTNKVIDEARKLGVL